MAKSVFRRLRAIPDKVLGYTLSNHAQALQYAVTRIEAYDRWKWVRRAWAVGITAAVAWLAHGDTVQAYLNQWWSR